MGLASLVLVLLDGESWSLLVYDGSNGEFWVVAYGYCLWFWLRTLVFRPSSCHYVYVSFGG